MIEDSQKNLKKEKPNPSNQWEKISKTWIKIVEETQKIN